MVANISRVVLGTTYMHRKTGHRLHPYHLDVRAGAAHVRVQCHNFTTGYAESFSVRLFLADHDSEAR